jgi:hypothetical protein
MERSTLISWKHACFSAPACHPQWDQASKKNRRLKVKKHGADSDARIIPFLWLMQLMNQIKNLKFIYASSNAAGQHISGGISLDVLGCTGLTVWENMIKTII